MRGLRSPEVKCGSSSSSRHARPRVGQAPRGANLPLDRWCGRFLRGSARSASVPRRNVLRLLSRFGTLRLARPWQCRGEIAGACPRMHGVVGLIATLATAIVILRTWEAPRALVRAVICVGGLGTAIYASEVTRQPETPRAMASVADASLGSPPVPQGTWVEERPIPSAASRTAHAADAVARP